MEIAHCEICGCKRKVDIIFPYSDNYKLCRCNYCGLVFLHPEPDTITLEQIYSEERDFYSPPENYFSIQRRLKY